MSKRLSLLHNCEPCSISHQHMSDNHLAIGMPCGMESDTTIKPINNLINDTYTAMLDVSLNKKFVAYVTTSEKTKEESDYMRKKHVRTMGSSKDIHTDKQHFYLTVRSLLPDNLPLHVTIDISYLFPHQVDSYLAYFLSISSDGQYVAVTSLGQSSPRETCVIYQVVQDQLEKIEITLNAEGYGVFMESGQFALINHTSLFILDRHFKLHKSFDIAPLMNMFQSNTYAQTHEIYGHRWEPFCSIYTHSVLDDGWDMDPARTLFFVCKLAKHDCFLFKDNAGSYQLYTPRRHLECISSVPHSVLAITRDMSSCALIEDDQRIVILNNCKNVISYRLEPSKKMMFSKRMYRQNFAFEGVFSSCGRYFMMSGIKRKSNPKDGSVYIEVWDLLFEQSIYCHTFDLCNTKPPESSIPSFLRPFVILHNPKQSSNVYERPRITAYYMEVSEKQRLDLQSFPLYFGRRIEADKIRFEWQQTEIRRPYKWQQTRNWLFKESQEEQLHVISSKEKHVQLDTYFTICHLPGGATSVTFEINHEVYCVSLVRNIVEIWHRKPIENSPFEDLMKQNDYFNGNPQKETHYDHELMYIRYLTYVHTRPEMLPKSSFKLKKDISYDTYLKDIVPTTRDIEILKSNSSEGIIIRIKSANAIMEEHQEDIFVPFITPRYYKTETRREIWYYEYVFESACFALYLATMHKSYVRRLDRIERVLVQSLAKMRELGSTFFERARGSFSIKTLSMFKKGRAILFDLIQIPEFKICLFDHQHVRFSRDGVQEHRGSALRVLLEQMDFGLYKLLLNKIILDSVWIHGHPLAFCITDVLSLLQKTENKDLLSRTISSLDYIPIAKLELTSPFSLNIDTCYDTSLDLRAIKEKDISRNSCIRIEQMEDASQLYAARIGNFYPYQLVRRFQRIKERSMNESKSLTGNYIRPCVMPLAYINTYFNISTNLKPMFDTQQELYTDSSLFLDLATDHARYNVFDEGSQIIALILLHKWNQFVGYRYYQIYLFHVLFYATYFMAVPFALAAFGYVSGESSLSDNGRHVACVVLFLFSGACLFLQEVRQCRASPSHYFLSAYNYIDIVLLVTTFITFLQLICHLDYFDEVASVCTLIVWLHALLKLRTVQSFCITLEVLIQLFHKVSQIILIMVFVVFAFTHAFIVLLYKKEDSYFQEQYTADTGTVVMDSNENEFTNVFKAFRNVWFFVYGVWDPILSGDAADNTMLMLLAILFSFIVLLLVFNIVIGFMSASIEEVLQQSRRAWLNHFLEAVVEIEQFWCSHAEKTSRRNNPAWMYYAASKDEVIDQQKRLMDESKELVEEYQLFNTKESYEP